MGESRAGTRLLLSLSGGLLVSGPLQTSSPGPPCGAPAFTPRLQEPWLGRSFLLWLVSG